MAILAAWREKNKFEPVTSADGVPPLSLTLEDGRIDSRKGAKNAEEDFGLSFFSSPWRSWRLGERKKGLEQGNAPDARFAPEIFTLEDGRIDSRKGAKNAENERGQPGKLRSPHCSSREKPKPGARKSLAIFAAYERKKGLEQGNAPDVPRAGDFHVLS